MIKVEGDPDSPISHGTLCSIGQGTGRDYESHLYRFANLLGPPNILTAGDKCSISRAGATLITCGNLPVSDWNGGPRCVVMWGCNPQWTNSEMKHVTMEKEELIKGNVRTNTDMPEAGGMPMRE